jgi:hypothetical protein
MKYVRLVLVFILVLFLVHIAHTAPEKTPAKILYGTLFYPHAYDAENIDATNYPDRIRPRLVEYKTRNMNFSSKLPPEAEPNPDHTRNFIANAALEKKRGVEKAIVSLIDAAGIENIAAKFAEELPLSYEWEGFSDGPLAEADYVKKYLESNSGTPLKPYLVLFLIHRYRHGLEALKYERGTESVNGDPQRLSLNRETENKVIKLLDNYLNIAKNDPDPLVNWFAEYLENAKRL